MESLSVYHIDVDANDPRLDEEIIEETYRELLKEHVREEERQERYEETRKAMEERGKIPNTQASKRPRKDTVHPKNYSFSLTRVLDTSSLPKPQPNPPETTDSTSLGQPPQSPPDNAYLGPTPQSPQSPQSIGSGDEATTPTESQIDWSFANQDLSQFPLEKTVAKESVKYHFT